MLKLIDKLGEGLLRLARYVFLTKKARKQMDDMKDASAAGSENPKRATVTYAGSDGDRQALIAEAVSLHRSKQDVLSELDDESRKKLSAMAEKIMPVPGKKAARRKNS